MGIEGLLRSVKWVTKGPLRSVKWVTKRVAKRLNGECGVLENCAGLGLGVITPENSKIQHLEPS